MARDPFGIYDNGLHCINIPDPQTTYTWTNTEVSKTVLMEPGPLSMDWPKEDSTRLWASAGTCRALGGEVLWASSEAEKPWGTPFRLFSSSFWTAPKEAAWQVLGDMLTPGRVVLG